MSSERCATTMVIGLTGGMGSGKSTVSTDFAERGAVVLDADKIVWELQRPDQPLLLGMVAILGEEIVTDEGELDRAAAGKRMFADEARKRAVEEMAHPLVWGELRTGIEQAKPDDIVILDVPLLFETQPESLRTDGNIVVDTEVGLAVDRLVRYRGFTEEEARKRISQQMSREERLRRADHVIPNNGSREELDRAIGTAWNWVARLAEAS